MRVDSKDESRIIAYIQAVTQVLLNLATADFKNSTGMNQDTAMKFVASTLSTMSEYIVNSTWKIQQATLSAIKLIVSHGLGNQVSADSDSMMTGTGGVSGFDKVYMNIKYFLSERFSEYSATTKGNADTLSCSFSIIRTYVDKVAHP